jgi:hypothetical protein
MFSYAHYSAYANKDFDPEVALMTAGKGHKIFLNFYIVQSVKIVSLTLSKSAH